MAPSVTYNLYMLGLENNIVGITSFCPKGNTKKEIIGTILEPNIEKIVSLRPDIVILSKEANLRNAYARLGKFNIECLVLENDNSFVDICNNFQALAEKLGKSTAAEKIIKEAKAKIRVVKNRISDSPAPKVFWEIGAKPLVTVGRGSFIDDYNAYAGCINIFSDVNYRFPRITKEEVIKRDPDIILITEMGDMTVRERGFWMSVQNIKAVKTGKVFLLKSKELTSPNPRNFADGVELLAKLAHPDKFNE